MEKMTLNSKYNYNYSDMEITSFEEFEKIIGEFEESCNKIRDIIDKETKNAEKINNTDVWTGKAAEAVYDKYALLNSNYNQIDFSLQIYTSFLKKTLEDYKLIIKAQDNNIDAMASSLNVNS